MHCMLVLELCSPTTHGPDLAISNCNQGEAYTETVGMHVSLTRYTSSRPCQPVDLPIWSPNSRLYKLHISCSKSENLQPRTCSERPQQLLKQPAQTTGEKKLGLLLSASDRGKTLCGSCLSATGGGKNLYGFLLSSIDRGRESVVSLSAINRGYKSMGSFSDCEGQKFCRFFC